MDVFRKCFWEGARISLVHFKGFQEPQGPDMHIVLVTKSPFLPYGEPHTARGDIHEKEIVSQPFLLASVILLQPILQGEMLEINFLRHIHHLYVEARGDSNQIQNRTTIFCLAKYRCGIHRIDLHLVIIQKLLQSIQHGAELTNRGKRQFLVIKYFFPKRGILSHRFNDTHLTHVGVFYDAHGYIGRTDMNNPIH